MNKVIGILSIFLGACSMHSDIESIEMLELEQQTIAYSKTINYWIDGDYNGKGRNKQWIPGHWEKIVANPVFDPEYLWESGKWKEVKDEK